MWFLATHGLRKAEIPLSRILLVPDKRTFALGMASSGHFSVSQGYGDRWSSFISEDMETSRWLIVLPCGRAFPDTNRRPLLSPKKGNQDWTSKIAAIYSKTFKRISFCFFIILNLLLFKYLAFCTHFLKMVCVENRWLISEGCSSLGSSNDAYFSLFTVYFIDFIFFSCWYIVKCFQT